MDASSKAALRAEALARRGKIAAADANAFGTRLAERGAAFAAELGAKLAAAFWAINDEVPTLPLLEKLAAAGIGTALPAMCGFRKPLEFRQWRPGAPLAEAKWGIMEPLPAPEVFPDLVLVPLLAFDRGGNRLFAVQEFPTIPADAYDEKLDYVLTDRDWIVCGTATPAA
jgi:5-formyltetrahydrofolate cyclo-ligase